MTGHGFCCLCQRREIAPRSRQSPKRTLLEMHRDTIVSCRRETRDTAELDLSTPRKTRSCGSLCRSETCALPLHSFIKRRKVIRMSIHPSTTIECKKNTECNWHTENTAKYRQLLPTLLTFFLLNKVLQNPYPFQSGGLCV